MTRLLFGDGCDDEVDHTFGMRPRLTPRRCDLQLDSFLSYNRLRHCHHVDIPNECQQMGKESAVARFDALSQI